MIRKLAVSISLLSLLAISCPLSVGAQGAVQSQGVMGSTGGSSQSSRNFRLPDARNSSNQRAAFLPTGLGGTASIHGPRGRNGLPPTRLDSFVLNAGGSAEQIYGDEGSGGLPPYFGFSQAHRINRGIQGDRDKGLTTGHGSVLPNAWGWEWEQSRSGSGSGGQYWTPNQADLGTNPNITNPGIPSNLPYTPGPDWAAVHDNETGQLMGHMAPGETWSQFFSGESGHLLPGFESKGADILQNQITNPNNTFGDGP